MTTFGQSELVTLPVTRIFRLPLSKGVFGKQLEGLILGNGMGYLGTPTPSKTDEFSEKFQTAFDLRPSYVFGRNIADFGEWKVCVIS